MKDLDFDELDRAVNSLMTNVSKSDESKPEEAEKTLNIPSTLDDATKPSPSAPAASMPTPSPSPAPVAPPSRSPLAARRGGRFMDVVHPSSDMKTASAVPARPVVARQGATIAPSQSLSAVMPSSHSVVTQHSDAKKEESPVAATPANDWPDPLELADFKGGSVATEEPAKPEEAPSIETAEPDTDPSPLTSPFLSGTKVEKRPLGGSGMAESTNEPDRAPVFGSKADADMTISDPEAQLPPEPKDTEQELPEELKGDLMAVEADTTTHQNKKIEETTKPPEEKSAVSAEHEPQPADTQAPALAASSDEKLLTAGPTSISQQYREEPSTGDQDNGAIYDTDTYHQPLAHPAKQKPGWMWVIWIVAILIIGAAGGATLYFLGIV